MAAYSPAVTWSGLSLSDPTLVTQGEQIVCEQPPSPWGDTALTAFPTSGNNTVSSPSTVGAISALLANGFTVSYVAGQSDGLLVHPTRLLTTLGTPIETRTRLASAVARASLLPSG